MICKKVKHYQSIYNKNILACNLYAINCPQRPDLEKSLQEIIIFEEEFADRSMSRGYLKKILPLRIIKRKR
jgi:hypothetical protein